MPIHYSWDNFIFVPVLWAIASSFIGAVIPVAIVLCIQRYYIRGIAGTDMNG